MGNEPQILFNSSVSANIKIVDLVSAIGILNFEITLDTTANIVKVVLQTRNDHLPGIYNLKIENRLIAPVRLIPFVTGWAFPPDDLVRMLAHRDGFSRVDLNSYHFDTKGSHHLILPKEWDACLADLEILTNKLKSIEKVEDENYPIWREQSIKILPAAAFVWLDELQKKYSIVYSKERMTLPNERQGDRELNLAPLIPIEVAELIYKGFETLVVGLDSSLPTSTSAEATNDNVNKFVLTGGHWAITYQGQTRTFSNTKGLSYIAWLIQNQDKKILVSDLYYAVNPPDVEAIDSTHSSMSARQLNESGLSVGDLGDAGDTLTLEGKKRLQQAIKDLQEQIEEANELGDIEKSAELEQQQEELIRYIAAESGLGGKTRKASSSIERIRTSVTMSVGRAKEKIAKEFPDLGQHLNAHLETGTHCKYTPYPPIDWTTDSI